MKILKQEFKGNKKDIFIQRIRVLLATKGIVLSDKTYEVLYWLLFYYYDEKMQYQGKEFKNMNQMHIAIAKEIGVYSSYVGAYINDRLVKNKIITKKMSLSADRFSKAKIDGYEIPQWLETIYHTEELKIETILNYE